MSFRRLSGFVSNCLAEVKSSAADKFRIALTGNLKPPTQKTLYKFDSPKTVLNWTVASDRHFGGGSDCSFTFDEAQKCVTFAGNLALGPSDRLKVPYCAIRSPRKVFTDDLSDFSGFQLRYISDGRPYTLSVKTLTPIPDEMYQFILLGEPNQETTVFIPFSKLLQTIRGNIQVPSRPMKATDVESIALSIVDYQQHLGTFNFKWFDMEAIRK